MIQADRFELLFSVEEMQAIAAKEAEIDKLLCDGRGVAAIKLGLKFDKRAYNELLKRYRDAGWHSHIGYEEKIDQYVFTIAHPRLDVVIPTDD